jgi:hypothetical protein
MQHPSCKIFRAAQPERHCQDLLLLLCMPLLLPQSLLPPPPLLLLLLRLLLPVCEPALLLLPVLLLLLLLLLLPVLSGPAGAAAITRAALTPRGMHLNAAAASLHAGATVGSSSGCESRVLSVAGFRSAAELLLMGQYAMILNQSSSKILAQWVTVAGDSSCTTVGLVCCCCCCCCCFCCGNAARPEHAVAKPCSSPAKAGAVQVLMCAILRACKLLTLQQLLAEHTVWHSAYQTYCTRSAIMR